MSSLPDGKLIESCVVGNREHYRQPYERYKDYVAGLVWRLVRIKIGARRTVDCFRVELKITRTPLKNKRVTIHGQQIRDATPSK